jgi:protein TonB
MVQGGFYETKRMKPGTVAIVVLLHGAAITAAMLAREGNFSRDPFKKTIIVDVPIDKPPPEKPQPPKPQPRQHEPVTTVYMPYQPPIETWTPPPTPPGPTKVENLPGPTTIDIPPSPPPPPPPPPPEVKLQPARAKANLGSYVSDADYPSDAIRREEQGTTRFRLAVGPDGRVTGCTVTGSSGSAALDIATCRVMRSRARFAPARDTSGNAVADAVSSAIVWRLPAG